MITASPRSWERTLYVMAEEARHSALPVSAPRGYPPPDDADLLERAYSRCDEVIAEHGKTFNMATRLLPPSKRRAIRALYAFCRVADDIVDDPDEPLAVKEAMLTVWRYITCPERSEVSMSAPTRDVLRIDCDDLVALAWADTRLRYGVPCGYCEQLVDGVAHDLHRQSYDTFDDLAAYAYGVASTVGLMMLRIIGTAPGFTEEDALPYAIKMGLALQITNILRDVGEDRRAGRVYLPADELKAWEISDAALAEGSQSEEAKKRWRDFMRFQVARNRVLYREAWPCVQMFSKDGRFCVAAMCSLYSAILDDIEKHDYEVANRRAHVSAWGKLRRLPSIWWQNHVTLETSEAR